MSPEARKTFLLRIPPALWTDLEKWAADELRSVNAQIEYVLRQAVARRKGGPGDAAGRSGAMAHVPGIAPERNR